MTQLKVIDGGLQQYEDALVAEVINGNLSDIEFDERVKKLEPRNGHLKLVSLKPNVNDDLNEG